jgi:hypothetical protein
LKLPSFLMVAFVMAEPVQLPFTGVALKVPEIDDPFRKPFETLPERVNLKGVDVALRVIVPDDVVPLLFLAVKVPVAEPLMQVRVLLVSLILPLVLVAPETLVQLLALKVADREFFLAVSRRPGLMVAVADAALHVVPVAAGTLAALAAGPAARAIPVRLATLMAAPAIAALSLRVSCMVV